MDDGDQDDPSGAFPDELTVDGYDFRLVAHKQGIDSRGVMRYRVKYNSGEPVNVHSVEYKRNEIALVFQSRLGGKVAFNFKLREGEQ